MVRFMSLSWADMKLVTTRQGMPSRRITGTNHKDWNQLIQDIWSFVQSLKVFLISYQGEHCFVLVWTHLVFTSCLVWTHLLFTLKCNNGRDRREGTVINRLKLHKQESSNKVMWPRSTWWVRLSVLIRCEKYNLFYCSSTLFLVITFPL